MTRRISGRTRRGRLRLFDQWWLSVCEHAPSTVVDIGFGEEPWTTFEFEDALRQRWPDRQVGLTALDIDVERAREQGIARGSAISFVRPDGFELPVVDADMVRAFNVLRGYTVADASAAWTQWAAALAPNGRLYEGSTDHDGHVLVAAEVDSGSHLRGLLFATDFERGFAPRLFRDWLPRQWRRGGDPEHWVWAWLDAWHASWVVARRTAPSREQTLAELFVASMPHEWVTKVVTLPAGLAVFVEAP